MDWYGKVKRYYEKGFYSNEQVKIFVEVGKISAEEYKEITGEVCIIEESDEANE